MIRLEFACKDKSCAPPPVGTGGSNPSGAGRAATAVDALRMSLDSRDGLREMVLDKYPSMFRNQMPDGLYDDYEAAVQLIAYTGVEHQTINESLRMAYSGKAAIVAPPPSSKVQLMDRAFKNHSVELTEPITVYRGMQLTTPRPSPLLDPQVGDVLEDKGFMSTSYSGDQATLFAVGNAGKSVVMRIKVPAGTRVVAGNEDESELILNRGTKVRVTGVDKVVRSESNIWTQWKEGDARKPTTVVDVEVIE